MCSISAPSSPTTPPPSPPPGPKIVKHEAPTQAPSPLSPIPKSLNPQAQPFKPLLLAKIQQSLQTPVCHYTPAPAMTGGFSFPHPYFYQPKPAWPSYTVKIETYSAFQASLRGNGVPFNVNGHGVSGRGKKKMMGAKRWHRKDNKVWAPKKTDGKKGDSGGSVFDAPATDFDTMVGRNTTLMIRNVPNQLGRQDLLRILDNHCLKENLMAKGRSDPCRSEYDFVYLPMDFGYSANLGYAFVNFTSAVGAMRFCNAFNKFEWEAEVPGSKKICEVTRAAIQGKNGMKKHFELSKFFCHTDGYLPVILSPPRDGFKHTRPTIVGKRIDSGSPPVDRRDLRLTMRKSFRK